MNKGGNGRQAGLKSLSPTVDLGAEGICSKQRQQKVILTEERKDGGSQSPEIHHKKRIDRRGKQH